MEAKTLCDSVSLFDPGKLLPNFKNFLFFFHSSYFFDSVIQLLLFVRSYFAFSFVSSGFKNSLMSSSHLLLGLPTSLRVLILLSSPGCQSKIFLVHLSSGKDAFLLAIRHFSLLCVSIQHGIFSSFHVFFSFFGASLDVLFNPIFFFFGGVNCSVYFLLEGHFTVLIFVGVLM